MTVNTLVQLPKASFRKRYQDIIFSIPLTKRKNVYTITFKQPEKLFRGKYAYYYKFNYKSEYNRFGNGGYNCENTHTFDSEKSLLKALRAEIAAREKNKNTQQYTINIFVPFTKYYVTQLEKAKKDSLSAKNDIILTDKLFKGKYSSKVTIKLKPKSLGMTEIDKIKGFVDSFEPIFTLYNYEQSSDVHEFTQTIVNKYNDCKEFLDKKVKNGKVIGRTVIPKIQGNFTTYFANEDEMATVLFYIDKSFKLVSRVTIRQPEAHRYVKKD